MRIQTMLPEQDRKKIEEYKEKIQERMESYFDDIDSASAFSIREMTEAIRQMNNDPIIKLYEKNNRRYLHLQYSSNDCNFRIKRRYKNIGKVDWKR